jgi:hypothetical protein
VHPSFAETAAAAQILRYLLRSGRQLTAACHIYLHYVFDLWVDVWRKKYAQGDVIVLPDADNNVLGFQHRAEADRFVTEFRKRLKKFGLELRPDTARRSSSDDLPSKTGNREEKATRDVRLFGFTHITGKKRDGTLCLSARRSAS